MPADDRLDLVALIAGRVERLIEDCEAGLEALEQSLPSLRDARDRVFLSSRASARREVGSRRVGGEAPTQQAGVARVRVEHASVDELLDFQEQLARLPGVTGVSISAMGDDGASLIVEMQPDGPDATNGEAEAHEGDGPTVLCAVCGRVISKGGDLISHGLCPGCTESFMRGEVLR